jgi:3D-(3,5/4)-trihydroxycyclohexane-1,2-dione acylhydrolase (decyclizing)
MPESPGAKVWLTTAQALVKYLQVQFSERDGVTRRLIPAVFGIFGHGNVNGLAQALYAYGDDLPYYQPCNEQQMVHTAIAYARANARLSTFACTASIGPGSTNMLTGAATATIDRVPVLLLPADYFANRYQGRVLQQLEHPILADVSVNDCFRPISRFFDRISRPEQLLTALPDAMRTLVDPVNTGTVTVALPQDVGVEAYDYPVALFQKRVWHVVRQLPHPQPVGQAAQLIAGARRPLILAGGGVHYSEAWDELQLFSETFGIPVSETYGGKGAMRNPSPIALGGGGSHGNPASGKIAARADLVICIGSRLNDLATGSHTAFQDPDVRFIHVNVCSHDAHKLGALPILADAREALRALQAACLAAGVKPQSEWVQEARAAKAGWEQLKRDVIYTQAPGEAMSQGQVIGILNQQAQPGDIIETAAGTPPGDLLKLWDVTGDRPCQLEMGNSCMGYELPGGLGLRLARPKGEVYVLIGDGTYLMNPTELVTALQERLKMTVVLSVNLGYQSITALQMSTSGHPFGTELRARDAASNRLDGAYLKIDYAGNAASMGARVWTAATPDALREALREARQERRTCVIVVPVQEHRFVPGSGVYWEVPPPEVSDDPTTQALRAEYEAVYRPRQRFYY